MLFIIRIILIVLWVIFATLCGIIASLLRPFNPHNIRVTTTLLVYGLKILGIKAIMRNREIMDPARPCVFISNHQHNIDIFIGSFALPERTVSMGKRSLIYVPFFGLFYWLSGNILIDRKNKRSAFDTMDEAAKAIKKKNTSVWIMPEGTRSKGRGLLPFKKGPFVTAIKADVVILPVVFSNYVNKIHLNRWHSGTIIAEALPPISTHGLTMNDVNELKDRTFLLMKNTLIKLDAEVDALTKRE